MKLSHLITWKINGLREFKIFISYSTRHFYCVNRNKRYYWDQYFISTFSNHITIFRTLWIGIWQLKCQKRQSNKTKNCELFFCKLFRIIKYFFLILLREATLESKVCLTNRNSLAFLLHTNNAVFSQALLLRKSQ